MNNIKLNTDAKAHATAAIALLAGLLLLFPLPGAAQEKNEEVTIIAPYRPSVSTARKINRNPRIRMQESTAMPEIEYSIRSEKTATEVRAESPQPSRVPGEPYKDLYRSHLRAGFGNYYTPYLELWVNSLQSDRFNAGAHLRHLSSFGEIKDYAKSNFSNTGVDAHATRFFRNASLAAGVDYKRRMVHRYGFKPDEFAEADIPEDEDIRQVFNRVGMNMALESKRADEFAFNYRLGVDGQYLFDKFDSREAGIFADAGVSKKIDIFNNRRGQELGLDLGAEYFMNQDSLDDHNSGILHARPYFDMDLHPYRLYVGLQADYRLDTTTKLHLYPALRLEASLMEEMLVVYAGLEGGLERNSYEALSSENPYMNAIVPLEYTSHELQVFGGIKGRVAELVDFNLSAGHSTFKNMPLFINDTSSLLMNTFDVVYDDGNLFYLKGELGFRSKSDFGLLLHASYHAYSMKNEEKAWHRPGLSATLKGWYMIQKKLTLSTSLLARGPAYALETSDEGILAEQIDGWLDLGLGAEYLISRRFSAFLKLNNLLNSAYRKWYNYPVQRLTVMAGVGISF